MEISKDELCRRACRSKVLYIWRKKEEMTTSRSLPVQVSEIMEHVDSYPEF